MIDVDPSVWPERRHFAGFVIGRETGTLKILVKWRHEDPLITPTLRAVLYEGPCRDLFTQIVSQKTSLMSGWKTDGEDEDGREENHKEHHYDHSQHCHKSSIGFLQVIIIVFIEQGSK